MIDQAKRSLSWMSRYVGLSLFLALSIGATKAAKSDSIYVHCPDHWPGPIERGTAITLVEWRDMLFTNQIPHEIISTGRTGITRSIYRKIKLDDPVYLICGYANGLFVIFRFDDPVGLCEVKSYVYDEPIDGKDYEINYAKCEVEVSDRATFERIRPHLTEPIDLRTSIEGFRLRQDRRSIMKHARDEGWIVDEDKSGQSGGNAELMRLKRGLRQVDVKFSAKSGLSREIVEYNATIGLDGGAFYESKVLRFGVDGYRRLGLSWQKSDVQILYNSSQSNPDRRATFHLIDLKAE